MGTNPSTWRKPVVCSFYRPQDKTEPEYLGQLQTSLSRISVGAHTMIGGDFNLGDIDWNTESIKPHASSPASCKQLLTLAKDNFLDQMVTHPTRITEDNENILDLFITGESS